MTPALATVAPALEFDEATHTYTVAGRRVLSVTQILTLAGLRDDFSAVPPDVLERKRQIGQAVHQATHYLDDGDLDLSTIDPLVAPYVRAYEDFKRESGFRPLYLETRIFHPLWRYAGTFDRLGVAGDKLVLLDLKTGDPASSATQLQTAAYFDAYRCMSLPVPSHRTVERWGVWLRDDAVYRCTAYRDPRDLGLFRAALQIANYKAFGVSR